MEKEERPRGGSKEEQQRHTKVRVHSFPYYVGMVVEMHHISKINATVHTSLDRKSALARR